MLLKEPADPACIPDFGLMILLCQIKWVIHYYTMLYYYTLLYMIIRHNGIIYQIHRFNGATLAICWPCDGPSLWTDDAKDEVLGG